jgi:hypothetical protein
MTTDKLSQILWLWVPAAIFIAQIALELLVPAQYLPALHSENGPHETLQFVFAAAGVVFALLCLIPSIRNKDLWLSLWSACFCLGCIYIAGEEISWGQHVFDWGTPEFWSQVNDQNETNLHNTSSWLDQKPRLILLIGIIVGGLIIPALQKFKPSLVPQQFKLIYPPASLAVTAAFAVVTKIIDKLQEAFDYNFFTRISEVEELYLFYFVLLYLVALRRRINKN